MATIEEEIAAAVAGEDTTSTVQTTSGGAIKATAKSGC